jgi:hypothetical protein
MNTYFEELGELIPLDGNICLSCYDISDNLINGHICYLCNSATYSVIKNDNDKYKILFSTNNFLKNELIRIKKKTSNRKDELNKFDKFSIKNKLNKREISKGRFLIKRKYRKYGSVRYAKKQKLAKNKHRGYKGRFCKKL